MYTLGTLLAKFVTEDQKAFFGKVSMGVYSNFGGTKVVSFF
jgi:hypothetical protein